MPSFVFAYRAPKDYRGSPDAMAAWNALPLAGVL